MSMHLVVRYAEASADVDLSVEDPAAIVADLTSGLDGGRTEDLGVLVDGRWYGPDTLLTEASLYDGAVVEITAASASDASASGTRAPVAIAVVGGPAAGQTCPISRPTMTIGRDRQCDLVLDDPTVSRRHASISAAGVITDLDSR